MCHRRPELEGKPQPHAIKSKQPFYSDFEEEHYNLDVIEVSNLALAIKNREPTVNIEISLGCENLPEVDLFGLTDPMVVCFKKEPIPGSNEFELTEIGRTEIIPNELNPRFIKTFILSYNEERLDHVLRCVHSDRISDLRYR